MQVPIASKPRYVQAILRKIYFIDTKAVDPISQKAYLANTLVNPQGLPYTFYKIDLLLKHQNGKSKDFYLNVNLSLQETDEMFWLYAFLENTL